MCFYRLDLNVFCVGESAPRFMLACNLQGLVAPECVSCRRERSEVHFGINLQGLVAPECVSCRRERSKVHFDLLFTIVCEVLGVIVAQG